MADTDNNKLMGLLIIAGGGFVTESRTYKTNEKTKTIGASLDKKERK